MGECQVPGREQNADSSYYQNQGNQPKDLSSYKPGSHAYNVEKGYQDAVANKRDTYALSNPETGQMQNYRAGQTTINPGRAAQDAVEEIMVRTRSGSKAVKVGKMADGRIGLIDVSGDSNSPMKAANYQGSYGGFTEQDKYVPLNDIDDDMTAATPYGAKLLAEMRARKKANGGRL